MKDSGEDAALAGVLPALLAVLVLEPLPLVLLSLLALAILLALV